MAPSDPWWRETELLRLASEVRKAHEGALAALARADAERTPEARAAVGQARARVEEARERLAVLERALADGWGPARP